MLLLKGGGRNDLVELCRGIYAKLKDIPTLPTPADNEVCDSSDDEATGDE